LVYQKYKCFPILGKLILLSYINKFPDVKFLLPDLFGIKKIMALEHQIKAITNIYHPALTAQLSEQVWGRGYNTNPAIYPDWTTTAASNYYTTSDQVYAVVNKIAETTSLIPFYVYYQKDEKNLRKLNTLTNRQFYSSKGLIDILLMQQKALEDAPETDDLVKLLSTPNPYQSQQEFFLACFCYYLLNGECFIYKYKPGTGANDGRVTELYVLPPSTIIVHVGKDYPQVVTGYEFVIAGQTIYKQIPAKDIIHIKKFNPENTYGYDIVSNYARFRGLSPLIPGNKLLTRLTAADDAAVAQLQNGGVPGIAYDADNQDITQETLDNYKKNFYGYLRNPDNKGLPMFTAGANWKYVQMGLKLADLEVIELQKMDFKRLCNIYKVSTILFNSDVAATESNVNEMVKQMYTSVCLPLAYTFRDKFNNELASAVFGDKRKRFIDVDISGITELQDDYQSLANVLSALPITPTGNEMRELFKWDRIENETMDIPLVKAGYSLIDDLAPMDGPVE
jgi:HK97 family phage portal protein